MVNITHTIYINTILSFSKEESIFSNVLSIDSGIFSTPKIHEQKIQLIRFYVDQQRSIIIFDASKTNDELFKEEWITISGKNETTFRFYDELRQIIS